jgi:DNA-binding Lrp family transcriptional regulator
MLKTGNSTMTKLDATDIEILHTLQNDAKINMKELSEKIHSKPSACHV